MGQDSLLYSREQRVSVHRLLTENDNHRENRNNLPMTQNVVSNQPLPAQKKSRRGLYSQTRNNRWKWMAGATAATAAGVTASQAGTITINLVNNFISAVGGNHLNADLTGDGQPDLTIANPSNGMYNHPPSNGTVYFAGVNLNGIRAFARYNRYNLTGDLTLGSKHAHFFDGGATNYPYGYGTANLTGSIPISFTDLHINGGALTKGSLEVTVSGPNAEIQLDSFTYNTTPDEGSTFALLAMGASGILALRRWRAAQKPS